MMKRINIEIFFDGEYDLETHMKVIQELIHNNVLKQRDEVFHTDRTGFRYKVCDDLTIEESA